MEHIVGYMIAANKGEEVRKGLFMMSSGYGFSVPQEVIEYGSRGLSFVCYLCEHWWRAVKNRRGVATCKESSCGGPFSSKAFPRYAGALHGVMSKYCFVCGEKSVGVLKIGDAFNLVGVCDKHVDLVKENVKKGKVV